MGTNLTRNAAPTGSNIERDQYAEHSENTAWEELEDDMTWDSSDPRTWNDFSSGAPGGTNPGTNLTRESAPSGSNLARN